MSQVVATGSTDAAAAAVAAAAAGAPTGRKGLTELIKTNMAEIEKALPPGIMDADRFARIILTEFRKTPKLQFCTPESFLGALFQVAQLGLEPGGQLGHAFLIPYDNSRLHVTECQLQVGYKGFVELGGRRGILMRAREVRKGDRFAFDLGSNEFLHHDWELEENTSRLEQPVIGYWGKVVMPDGKVTFTVMDKSEINARRNRSAAVRSGKKTPWDSDYDAMARKTVIRAMVPQVALAPELQIALRADEAVIQRAPTGDLSYLYRDAIDATAQLGGASVSKEAVTEALSAMESNSEKLRCSKYLLDNFGPIETLSDDAAPALLKIIREWPAVLTRDTVAADRAENDAAGVANIPTTGEIFGDETEAILQELDEDLRAQARSHLEEWVESHEAASDDATALELESWLAEPQDSAAQTPSEPQDAPAGTDAQASEPTPSDPQGAAPGGVSQEVTDTLQSQIATWPLEQVKEKLRAFGEPTTGADKALRLRLLMAVGPRYVRGDSEVTILFA